MKDNDKIRIALGVLGDGTWAVFSALSPHPLRTFRFLATAAWVLYKHVALFSPLAKASCATAGQGLRGGGCGHLELSGRGGSHGWNYLIRTGIQPRIIPVGPFTNTS